MVSISSTGDEFTGALVAAGPTPLYAHRIATFGALVGAWSVTGKRRESADGDWADVAFEWRVAFILDGRGVQDVSTTGNTDVPGGVETVSTAVRVYDPVLGAWRVSYVEPRRGEYAHLVATAHRDGIRQDGTRNDDKLIRWNFTRIADDTYAWESWVSDDEGDTWWLQAHNEGSRITAGGAA